MIDKKAQIYKILIQVILVVLGFLVILTFITTNVNHLASESEDKACTFFISGKESSLYQNTDEAGKLFGSNDINLFLRKLNGLCKTDQVTSDAQTKEEAFEEVATSMNRCWKRYGEGEYEFLESTKTQGQWCFTCAVVEFEDDIEGESIVPYNEYVDWLKGDNFVEEEDEDGATNKVRYYDAFRVKYVDISDEQLQELNINILEVLGEEDSSTKELATVLTDQFQALKDLKLKEINLQEKNYVVYRVDRIERDFDERVLDAGQGALYGSLGALAAGALFESAAITGVCAAGSLVATGGLGAPLCAVGGAVTFVGKFVSNVVDVAVTSSRITTKIFRIMKSIKESVSFSKELRVAENVERIVVDEKTYHIYEGIKNFDADPADLRKFEQVIRASDPQRADDIKALADLMEGMDIPRLSSLNVEIMKNEDNLRKLQEFFNSPDIDHERFIDDLAAQETDLVKQISEHKAFLELAREEVGSVGSLDVQKLDQTDGVGVRSYLRFFAAGGAGVLGAAIYGGSDMKSIQYVDLLTQEQYYRLCGTAPVME